MIGIIRCMFRGRCLWQILPSSLCSYKDDLYKCSCCGSFKRQRRWGN